jgi:hypothetical protein
MVTVVGLEKKKAAIGSAGQTIAPLYAGLTWG